MLTSEEHVTIVDALQEWALCAPDEPILGFIQSDGLKTPQEILSAIKENSSDGKAVMQMIEHSVRRIGLEDVVRRIRAQSKSIETF